MRARSRSCSGPKPGSSRRARKCPRRRVPWPRRRRRSPPTRPDSPHRAAKQSGAGGAIRRLFLAADAHALSRAVRRRRSFARVPCDAAGSPSPHVADDAQERAHLGLLALLGRVDELQRRREPRLGQHRRARRRPRLPAQGPRGRARRRGPRRRASGSPLRCRPRSASSARSRARRTDASRARGAC